MYFIVSSQPCGLAATLYSRWVESEIDISTGVLYGSSLRRVCDLNQWPDLDGSNARAWNSRGDANRFVAILGMDQEIARDLLPRLDKWPVRYERFALAHSNHGRRRRRLQRRRAQIFLVSVELVRKPHGFGKDFLLFFFSDLVEDDFVIINQQHVFHLYLLNKVKAPR